MISPKIGDVVTVARRGVDAVVTNTRRITRGRSAGQIEYTCAPIVFGDKPYYLTCRASHLTECRKGYTPAELAAARGEQQALETQRTESKLARAQKGQETLNQVGDLRPGDEVLIDFSDGKRWKVVGDVNLKTGKIGIERANTAEIRDANARAKRGERDPMLDIIPGGLLPLGRRPRKRRALRWLPANLILEVRGRQAETAVSDDGQVLDEELLERARREMEGF